MTVDARRPSPVDPVDLGVDRQESSELFGDMGDFGDLLGEMLAMENDLEGTGIPSPSPREKSLGWLATKEEQLDEAEDAACNPDLASSRPGAVTSANDPLYVDRVQRARSELERRKSSSARCAAILRASTVTEKNSWV